MGRNHSEETALNLLLGAEGQSITNRYATPHTHLHDWRIIGYCLNRPQASGADRACPVRVPVTAWSNTAKWHAGASVAHCPIQRFPHYAHIKLRSH
jgi:hypothetical protein